MRALRGHKLHQFHLYQISHLPVKEKLRTNYAIMHAFSVRLCKNAELVYSCPYALNAHYRRTTGHELCQSFLPTNSALRNPAIDRSEGTTHDIRNKSAQF